MARLRDAAPKNASGAYERLFGDQELGTLASKIHSTVISSGNELERMIANLVPNVPNLDKFLEQEIMDEGVRLVRKSQIKECQTLDFSGSEPDFIVFKRRNGKQNCHIIELKDGHVFDTKKSSAEHQTLHRFIEQNGRHIPYTVSAHFCGFNQDSKIAVYEGFKKKITIDEAMTGRELCTLLEIDYDEIIAKRQAFAADNVEFLLTELTQIGSVRERLKELLE